MKANGRVLIVGAFPPVRSKPALLANQQILDFKQEGREVFTRGFADGSTANIHFSSASLRGQLKSMIFTLMTCFRFRRVYAHLSRDLFFPRLINSNAWLLGFQYLHLLVMALCYGRRFRLVVHELPDERSGFILRLLRQVTFSFVRHFEFLTEQDQRIFAEKYGSFNFLSKYTLMDRQGADMENPLLSKTIPRGFWTSVLLERKRLLFLCLENQGVQYREQNSYGFKLAKALRLRGVSVDVWAESLDSCNEFADVVEVRHFEKGLVQALKQAHSQYDVIQLFDYSSNLTHELASICPEKTVLFPYFRDDEHLSQAKHRHLFSKIRGALCLSEAASNWVAYKSQAGLVPDLCKIVGMGVEPIPDPIKCTNRLQGILPGSFVLIEGRHIEVHREWLCDRKVIAIGTTGVEDTGVQVYSDVSPEEARWLYKNCLAYVNLSQEEGFAESLFYAWHEGTPVILHKDALALASHFHRAGGEAGFLVTSSTELKDALQTIEGDSSLRNKLGIKGRRYAAQNFSWESVCNRYAGGVSDLMNWRTQRLSLESLNALPMEVAQPSLLGETFYAQFEESYRDGDEAPEAWRHYKEKYHDTLPDGAVVIDIGSGRGDFLEYLRGEEGQERRQYFGVDVDRYSCVELKRKNFWGACMTAEEFSDKVVPECADFVCLMHVVEHMSWNAMIEMLAKVRNVVKPGGVLVVETPNMWSVLTSAMFFWNDPTHVRPVSPAALASALVSLGFELLEQREFSPHLDAKREADLKESLNDEEFWKSYYGKQDFSVICRRID